MKQIPSVYGYFQPTPSYLGWASPHSAKFPDLFPGSCLRRPTGTRITGEDMRGPYMALLAQARSRASQASHFKGRCRKQASVVRQSLNSLHLLALKGQDACAAHKGTNPPPRVSHPGLPWGLRHYRTFPLCGRPGFDPWVGKMPWRREWLPTPVFLPAKFLGEKDTVHGVPKSWTQLSN